MATWNIDRIDRYPYYATGGYYIPSLPKVVYKDEVLSESESFNKLEKVCEGCQAAGWTVVRNPTINHLGEEGFCISFFPPKSKAISQ